MNFVVAVSPRFDYGRADHHAALTPHGALHGALFRSPGLELGLSTSRPLEIAAIVLLRGKPNEAALGVSSLGE
jgi:hypothetical protein